MILNDAKKRVGIDKQSEHLATQHVVGMKRMFWGWAVKSWGNINESQNAEMKWINKIIVKNEYYFIQKHSNTEIKWCATQRNTRNMLLNGVKTL